MNLSPIALFVYNRLDCTQKTIEHLKANTLADQSELYIFSDGGKDEKSWEKVNRLRKYLHTITGFKEVHVIERSENYYLEKNIISGINEVLNKHDRIIVLEDDCCAAPYFLEYMNDAMSVYKEELSVMHIAGFTNLDVQGKGDTYLTPHMSGCGWGTWKNRWQKFIHYKNKEEALKDLSQQDIDKIQYGGVFKCLKYLDKNPIPWDICWNLCVLRNKGLCLHPRHTLIKNIGMYNGTHFSGLKNSRIFGYYTSDRPVLTEKISVEKLPISEDPEIEILNVKAFTDNGMRYNWFGKIVRKIYLKYFKSDN